LLFVWCVWFLSFSLSQSPGQYVIPTSGFPPYGADSGSVSIMHPSWVERQMIVWYNYVRTAPITFRDCFMSQAMYSKTDKSYATILNPSTYPAVSGIPWNLNLNRVARAHSTDRSGCSSSAGGSPHNDCNSTTFGTRIMSYYTPKGFYGEIYFDLSFATYNPLMSSFITVGGWICDGSVYSTGALTNCAVDGSGADGHRSNIMTIGGETGCGVAYRSQNAPIATCDMSIQSSAAYPSVKIFSASHIALPTPNSPNVPFSLAFIANFAASSAPTSSVVLVNGVSYNLKLNSGVANKGNYVSQQFVLPAAATPCYPYYFQFVTNGVTERYPVNGCFVTSGLGACGSTKLDSSSNSGWSSSCTNTAAPALSQAANPIQCASVPASTDEPSTGAMLTLSSTDEPSTGAMLTLSTWTVSACFVFAAWCWF